MIIAQRQFDELCVYKIIFKLDMPRGRSLGFCFACERNYISTSVDKVTKYYPEK